MSEISKNDIRRSSYILSFIAVVFVAANLRAPITAVGPVIEEISHALGLSKIAAGTLTSLPLLAFSLLSSLVPRLSQRYSMSLILLFSLILLSLGLALRSWGSLFTLFLGAALVGIAITFGNVLMPAFIKDKFPNKLGLMMGWYSVGMNLTAALAAGLSISIGQWTNMGWQASIGIWFILGLLGIVFWLPQLKRDKTQNNKEKSSQKNTSSLLNSRLAWSVTLFMGLQSVVFYCLSAWLPKVVQDWGMSAESSGWIFSYFQFAQLPTTFVGSIIATRRSNQKSLGMLVGFLISIGVLGIIFFKTQYIILCCILIGIGSGLAFSLSMLFFVLRTQSSLYAAKLSGMAQSFGYFIAALGPLIFGGLFDIFMTWSYSFLFLFLCGIALMMLGYTAGSNKKIQE